MYALSKLNKQNEHTWVNLQKRLNEVQFPYHKLFTAPEVYAFVKNKAVSVGSCEGYFIPSLLTTTAYLLASNDARVQTMTHQQPLNIFTIFVGYPGTSNSVITSAVRIREPSIVSLVFHFCINLLIILSYDTFTGKSSAIQHAAQDPLEQLEPTSSIISKTTSSGLVKMVATNSKGIILSPEIFDILNKLMKSDEDNARGDVQLLCKLFSGERCAYHFSTEQSRVIPANTAFSNLGSTQLFNVAKLMAKMDHGHGLVDRFLVATPLAYRPTLTEMETASQQVQTEAIHDFQECFESIYQNNEGNFSFTNDAQAPLREIIDQRFRWAWRGRVFYSCSWSSVPNASHQTMQRSRLSRMHHPYFCE